MSLLIKICGFTEASSLQVAVQAGVDAVGFVFAESPRRIEPKRAAKLASALPSNVLKVAVMRHPSKEQWRSVLDEFQPDVLQTDAEDYAELQVPSRLQRWPVFREGDGYFGDSHFRDSQIFVYEGKNSGRGETVDWSRAAQLASNGEMILAGGLSSANVAQAIAIVRPVGVDVSSGVESSPGVKDAQRIQDFINAARAAERLQ